MASNIILPTGRSGARIVATVAAVVLALLAVRLAFSFALVRTNPELAYRIDSGNAEAAAARADARMFAAKGPEDAARVRALSVAALRQSAYAPQALRNVGFVDAVTRGEGAAEAILKIAGRGSLRDFLVHTWLFGKYYREDAVPLAMRQADIVLSQQIDRWDAVMPAVIELLDDPRATRPLAQALARNPYWRGTFLQRMGIDEDNLDRKYALLLELKRLGQPATTGELTSYFNTIAEGTPPQVLRTRWLSLVGSQAAANAMLTDGGFEGVDLPPPYVWSFFPNGETYAESQRRTDGQGNALYASFDGRVSPGFATQRLALAPGRYRLSGEMLAEDDARPGQFSWRLKCGAAQGSGAAIGRFGLTADVISESWARFAADFTVPAECASQTLMLGADGIENGKTSSLWVDSLTIVPRTR